MPSFTPDQWALIVTGLLIALLVGVLIGANPKWKKRYREEHARYQALERDHEARIKAANARIAELEPHAPAIGAGTGAAIAGAAKGNDALSEIRGITREDEIVLNEMGYHRYKQIAKLSAAQQAEIEGGLGAEPGMIAREAWQEQARLLHKGETDEHRRQYRGSRD